MDLSRYKVKRAIGDLETHEVFLDKIAHKNEEELGISEKKFEVRINSRSVYIIFFLFFILAAVLMLKTFSLQILQGKSLAALADNNKGTISLIRPERGVIYDKNMKQLVSNSPAYDLTCDKRDFAGSANYDSEIQIIAQIISKSAQDLKNKIASSQDSQVLIAENLDQQTLLVLEARSSDLPDCQIEKNTVRNYAMGNVFAPVLGYEGRINRTELESVADYSLNDYIGKAGLEQYYESELRGTAGKTEITRDATGIKRGTEVLSEPVSGNNLVLNIDAGLQEATYDALEKSIKNIGASKGAAIAMNPRNGHVLALVSYPSYDDNLFSGGISQADYDSIIGDPNNPLFNRATTGQYPTGSAIKPFEALGALQEGIIDPNKLINDPGYILVHSQYDPNVTYKFGGVEPHGLVDMRKAIAVSSNIYFYTIGGGYGDQRGLGPTRIKKYLDLFGWEQKTGIDLPGEYSGFVPTPGWKKDTQGQPWWDGDTYNLSIGQSWLQVTPIQVAVAYCAIANGGTLYKPEIVNKIMSSDGKSIVAEFKPEVIRQGFIDPQNLEIVREGMRDGVDKPYGSSYYLNDLPVAVAGKTGTAQTSRDGYYNTWSANFAPYDNPEIVFVATIESVQGLKAATLPVAHDVLNYYFTQGGGAVISK